ncbi:hypothetical protein ACLEPN_15685 [Myxococcus sp. 1LA]
MASPPAPASPPPSIGINPGFVLGQLARALTTVETNPSLETRGRAAAKAADWQRVMEGLVSGALEVGSRTPVSNIPAWATLKVAQGGFATGELLAEGPLASHEQAWLKELGRAASHNPRAAMNAFFLSDEGVSLLGDMLATGAYRIDVPEEGAFLVAAWLLRHGDAERARTLLQELAPFFSRLRFYPVPHAPSMEDAGHVHLQSVGDTVAQLERTRPPEAIEQQRESAQVWTPLYDALVLLFLETRTTEGVCQHFPSDWSARAQALLDAVAQAFENHPLCKWPRRAGSHFAKLHEALTHAVRAQASLAPGQKRRVQHVLDDIAKARGLPGSERLQALRAEQQRIASLPLHADLADVLVQRLGAHARDGGLDSVEQVTGPVTEEEASRQDVAEGVAFPPTLVRKVMRCVDSSLEELIERKTITSSEVLAKVLPQVSAHVTALGVSDPELRRLYAHVYAAFRRRRSLLLLNLESQVKLQELPWVSAIDAHRTPNLGQREVAVQTLERITTLALSAFPDTLLPNKLLQELGALEKAAGLDAPLVEELAADIFMGTFAMKFQDVARRAAAFVQGSLYARYYDIPVAQSRMQSKSRASKQFDQLCLARARAEGHQNEGVSGNGMIIEQAQILTTHNLAILFEALNLTRTLGPRLPDMARRCFVSVCHLVLLDAPRYQHRLRNVKNAAYAWRQMVFFLSRLPRSEQEEFGQWAQQHLDAQPNQLASTFAPAFTRLLAVIQGQVPPLPGRVFLGWAVDGHWLLSRGN